METNNTLIHKIALFITEVNPRLDGIQLIYRVERDSPSIKFEFILKTKHVVGMWSPTNEAFEIVHETFEKYFNIGRERISYNNTRTVFWFYLN